MGAYVDNVRMPHLIHPPHTRTPKLPIFQLDSSVSIQCYLYNPIPAPDLTGVWQPQKTHLQVAFPSSTTQRPSLRHSTPVQASEGFSVDEDPGVVRVVGVVGVGLGWAVEFVGAVRWETSNQKHISPNNRYKVLKTVFFLVGLTKCICFVDLNELLSICLHVLEYSGFFCFVLYPPWWGERWRLHPSWSPCSWLWGGWGTLQYRSQVPDDRSNCRGWLHSQPCVDHPKRICRSLFNRMVEGFARTSLSQSEVVTHFDVKKNNAEWNVV